MQYTEEQLIERAKCYWSMYYTAKAPPENKLYIVPSNSEAYYWRYARVARIVDIYEACLGFVVHFHEGYKVFTEEDIRIHALAGTVRYYPATIPIEGMIGHM